MSAFVFWVIILVAMLFTARHLWLLMEQERILAELAASRCAVCLVPLDQAQYVGKGYVVCLACAPHVRAARQEVRRVA